jgi:hypothetical protein
MAFGGGTVGGRERQEPVGVTVCDQTGAVPPGERDDPGHQALG